MPLVSGAKAKTDKGFSQNIERERAAGKPEKQAVAIAYSKAREGKDDIGDPDSPIEFTIDKDKSAREHDINGWAEIKGNPLSKVGVFPYSGGQIAADLDPEKIYNVYRSEEELTKPDTIDSFKLLPWTDEHTMLGSSDEGLTPAERKGIHGVIGEDVYFEDGYLKGNLKIFSDKLKELIDSGKKELSIGYRCVYVPESGVYNGERYDFIQTDIRGNHLALVDEGRSGHDVAVLDHFKFTFDSKDLKMPEYEKEDMKEKKGDMMKPADRAKDEGEMSMQECREMLKKIAAHLDSMSDSKDEFEDDLEAREINESENDVIDEGDPADFVKRADITEDEDEDAKKEDSKKAAEEGDAKDEDMKKPDGDTGRKEGAMDSMKNVLKEISKRDALAEKLSRHIGTFDHKEKTLNEVARYGVKKLQLSCKRGHEESVLAGYLAGARLSSVSVAQDSKKQSSQIDAYLRGGK